MTNEVANESPEAKKAVFRRLVDIYAQAAVDALEEFVAPDYVGHTAAGERDLAEFRKSIINFHAILLRQRLFRDRRSVRRGRQGCYADDRAR